jgi:hypothetical protein
MDTPTARPGPPLLCSRVFQGFFKDFSRVVRVFQGFLGFFKGFSRVFRV